jgi:hypothetical protein
VNRFFFSILILALPLFAQDVIIDLNDDGEVVLTKESFSKFPFIELSYATAEFSNENFNYTIAKNGETQIKLGNSYLINKKNHKVIDKYFFLGYSSKSQYYKNGNYGFAALENWKGGIGNRVNYELMFSDNIGIAPYYSAGLFLYNMTASTSPVLSYYGSADEKILNRTADNKTHFGTFWDSGANLKLGNHFSLSAGYSGYVYYPRFLTIKFLGSFIAYQIGLSALDNFNKQIINRSKVVGAVVDVVLKSAYNYMFYHFQKGSVNWPFNSEAPFVQEGLAIGLSFKF